MASNDPTALDLLPPTLYHYTNWAGFEGICKSGTLRLSSIDAVNDRVELSYATDLLTDLVVGMKSKNCAHAAMQHLEGIRHACVASLTEETDLLSQWMSYAEKGNGVAIGFESGEIRSLVRKTKGRWRLIRIIYEPAEQARLFVDVIEDAEKAACIRSKRDLPCITRRCGAYRAYSRGVAKYGLAFKNPHWRAEREWRLTWTSRNPPERFRDQNGTAVVRCDFPMVVPERRRDEHPDLRIAPNVVVAGSKLHESRGWESRIWSVLGNACAGKQARPVNVIRSTATLQ